MLIVAKNRATLENICWHIAALPDSGILMWTDVDALPEDNRIPFAEAEDGRCAIMPLSASECDWDFLEEYFAKEIAAGLVEFRSSEWTTAVVEDMNGNPQTVTVAGVDWPKDWVPVDRMVT